MNVGRPVAEDHQDRPGELDVDAVLIDAPDLFVRKGPGVGRCGRAGTSLCYRAVRLDEEAPCPTRGIDDLVLARDVHDPDGAVDDAPRREVLPFACFEIGTSEHLK